jgi:hypothetical protein
MGPGHTGVANRAIFQHRSYKVSIQLNHATIGLQSPSHVHTFYIIYISLISINSSNNFSCIHLRFSFHILGVHLPCMFVIVSSTISLVPILSVFPFVYHFRFLMFVISFELISYLMIYLFGLRSSSSSPESVSLDMLHFILCLRIVGDQLLA